MISYLSGIDLRAKALLINVSVSLLIVVLFVALLLSHQHQLEEEINHQTLRLSSSLLEELRGKQANADNQLELLRHNEAVMDRLFQAEMENNIETLPLPESVLQQLDHDLFRLFDADGAVVARHGLSGDIIPLSLRKRSLRGFLHIDNGLMFVVQAPVIYGKQIMGYVALGDMLDKKALTALLRGHPFAGIQLFDGEHRLLTTEEDFDTAQTVNIGHDLSGRPITLAAGLNRQAMLNNSDQFLGWLVFGLASGILAWWLLYHRLIGNVVIRLYNTQNKLTQLQAGDIYPAPAQIADAIDRVDQGLHSMSVRLQLASKKLQLERQTLLEITDAAPIWIWKTNASGQLVFMNKEMRDTLHVQNESPLQLSDVLRLERAEEQLALFAGKDSDAIRRVMVGDDTLDMRMIIKTSTGRGASGNIGLALDMTEHLRMEANARHHQKMESLGTLVGGVAHNFNNMLAGMVGLVFLIRNKTSEQPDVVQYLDKLDATMDRAKEMVQQLLAFAHKGMDVKQHVDLGSIIKEAYTITRPGIPADIHFSAEISDEVMTVYGNASALQQMFVNLIVNARDAMDECRSNKVISTRLERMPIDAAMQQAHPKLGGGIVACLSVEDNGSGIDADNLKKIFEPFFTTKEVGKGTGLGLAMTIGTVESYGGWLEVDSTPGQGTVFRVFLPLAEQAESMPAAVDEQIKPGHQECILLVDDDPLLIEVGESILESLGYRVLTASDGRQALALFTQHQSEIDLVMTDVIMPVMSGIELYAAVRDLDENIPVVFVSGYDKEALNLPDANQRYDCLISKPYQVEAISGLLSHLLSNNNRTTEKYRIE